MTKRERTRATVGDRIAAKASAEFGYPGDVPIEDLARRIDAAVKRAVRERDKQWEAAGAFAPSAYRMMKKMLEVK